MHYASISVYDVIDQTSVNTEDVTEEDYTPYENRPETYIVPLVFLLILLIGLAGNGVLALTILRHSNMRNVPNIYVFSLALGDLLARVHSYSRIVFSRFPVAGRVNDRVAMGIFRIELGR